MGISRNTEDGKILFHYAGAIQIIPADTILPIDGTGIELTLGSDVGCKLNGQFLHFENDIEIEVSFDEGITWGQIYDINGKNTFRRGRINTFQIYVGQNDTIKFRINKEMHLVYALVYQSDM